MGCTTQKASALPPQSVMQDQILTQIKSSQEQNRENKKLKHNKSKRLSSKSQTTTSEIKTKLRPLQRAKTPRTLELERQIAEIEAELKLHDAKALENDVQKQFIAESARTEYPILKKFQVQFLRLKSEEKFEDLEKFHEELQEQVQKNAENILKFQDQQLVKENELLIKLMGEVVEVM